MIVWWDRWEVKRPDQKEHYAVEALGVENEPASRPWLLQQIQTEFERVNSLPEIVNQGSD